MNQQVCGVNVAFGVVGGKWKPTILWQLSMGVTRFGALRRAIGGITEKVLAQQLRDLEAEGIVQRMEFPGFPLRVEYSLTLSGERLNEALEAVAQWGHDHAATASRPGAGTAR